MDNRLKRLGHAIGGLLAALLLGLLKKPKLAIVLIAMFILYEVIEYLQIRDTLWRDIGDYVVGLYAGALLIAVAAVYRRLKKPRA